MIITGAALLGQILTNRTSSGSPSANAAPATPEAQPPSKPEPTPTPAPVAMSLSMFDALFALQASPRGGGASVDSSARMAAPSSGATSGLQQTRARTTVDPDLVRAITAALDSRKGDDFGLTATGQRSTVALETSLSHQNSLKDAWELAGGV